MMTEVEKPVTFDESCAQEVTPARTLEAAARLESQPQKAGGKLERLDLLMWTLCFAMGIFFAIEVLPLIQTHVFRF